MAIDVYYHERCGKCGDIRRALKKHDVTYEGHYFPPENPNISALRGDLTDPVLVDDDRAPRGVVGHDDILEWVTEQDDK